MQNTLSNLTDSSLEKLRYFLDLSTASLDKVIQRLGPQGYFFYGILSNTFFFFSSLVIKFYPQVDWVICVIIRGIVTFIGSYIISIAYKQNLYFEGNEFKYVTIRNVMMAIQQSFMYYVLLVVPLNITWIINNTGPIYVFIIGYFLLGTSLSKKDIISLGISVIGINIITAPQIFMKMLALVLPITVEDSSSELSAFQMLIAFLFFASQGLWAYGIVIVRFSKTASSLSINNSLGLIMIIFGSIALFFKSETITMPSISDLFVVFALLGIPTFIGQLLFIHGTLVAEDQGKFSLTNYIPVFYSYFYSIAFQSKIPEVMEFFGVFLTFYGLYKVVVKPKPTIEDEKRQSLLTENDLVELDGFAQHYRESQQLRKSKAQERAKSLLGV